MDLKSHKALRQTSYSIVLLTLALIILVFKSSVWAEEKTNEKSGWEFELAPHLWALSLSGDVTVEGRETHIDVGFDKILEELNIAEMLEFNAGTDRFGILGNIIYANLGDSTDRVDPKLNTLWAGLGGYYRLGAWSLSNAPGKELPAVTLDTYFGARFT
jgi:hypothetical protein